MVGPIIDTGYKIMSRTLKVLDSRVNSQRTFLKALE